MHPWRHRRGLDREQQPVKPGRHQQFLDQLLFGARSRPQHVGKVVLEEATERIPTGLAAAKMQARARRHCDPGRQGQIAKRWPKHIAREVRRGPTGEVHGRRSFRHRIEQT